MGNGDEEAAGAWVVPEIAGNVFNLSLHYWEKRAQFEFRQFKEFAGKIYTFFEEAGATVEQVAETVEATLKDVEDFAEDKGCRMYANVLALRTDISTHLGISIHDKFDRKKHTHLFANAHLSAFGKGL